MRPAFITITRSASARISSSSLRHQQHRAAGVAHRAQAAVDEFDGADVDAARGLAHQQHLRFGQASRASTSFCWLPPLNLDERSSGLRGRTS
jgi:vacuolar-type H+-ATPase subunit B/Vma2